MGHGTAAVIFYSLDGNTRHMAEIIRDEVDGDLIELRPTLKQDDEKAIKHIWGSTKVTLPEEPTLHSIEEDLDKYDLLYLGTPVWAGGIAPPVKRFLSEREFFRRDFAVFASYSGRTGRVFQEFRKHLAGNELLGELGVREPLERKGPDLEERIRAWTRETKEKRH